MRTQQLFHLQKALVLHAGEHEGDDEEDEEEQEQKGGKETEKGSTGGAGNSPIAQA